MRPDTFCPTCSRRIPCPAFTTVCLFCNPPLTPQQRLAALAELAETAKSLPVRDEAKRYIRPFGLG